MPRSYKVMGQELAPFVTDWGQVEEIKEVNLAVSTLFMGTHDITLANDTGQFSPMKAKGLFNGRSMQLKQADLSLDGTNLFSGLIRNVSPDSASRTVKISAENVFTRPANSAIVLSATAATLRASCSPVTWPLIGTFTRPTP